MINSTSIFLYRSRHQANSSIAAFEISSFVRSGLFVRGFGRSERAPCSTAARISAARISPFTRLFLTSFRRKYASRRSPLGVSSANEQRGSK
jgi:hypothetical protein